MMLTRGVIETRRTKVKLIETQEMGDIKEARESVDGAVGSVEEHVTLEQQVYKQLFEDK